MTSFMDSLRRGLDRASYEADKLMRYNRVRGEALRIGNQAQEKVQGLGERVMELYTAGTLQDPDLRTLAGEIADLREQARQKEAEAATIQGEVWIEPPDGTPAAAPQPPPAPAYQPPIQAQPPASPPPAPAWTPPPPAPTPPPAPAPSWSSGPVRPLPNIDDQGTHRIPSPERNNTYCPVCGAPLRPQAAFCAQCGVRL